MAVNDQSRPWETQFLLRVGLVIYTVTVLIGLFNGFHFVEVPRAVLLTHLHAGTLGWITLGAFAAAFWLYSGTGARMDDHARGVALAMAIAVPLYVAAFLSGNLVLRAIFGTPVLLLIVGMAVYLFRNIGSGPLTAPRLGLLLSFTVLVIGSTIGVLIQIQGAANHTFLPDNAIAGHAAAQVAGYLVLSALSIIDWRLNGTKKLGWAGGVQVVLLFTAGILVAGIGNGDGREGMVSGRLIGTYLHGPVLARNPALADLLLSWAVGPVAPLAQPHVEALRADPVTRHVPIMILTARNLTAADKRQLNGHVSTILSRGSTAAADLVEHLRRLVPIPVAAS